MRRAAGIVVLLLLTLAGCQRTPERPAPPQVTTAPEFPRHESTLSVPVELSLDDIQRSLERSTPRRLWSIDQQERKCVPGQRVKIFGDRVKVTPDIGCRIVGQVTRGSLSVAGKGERITISMPVHATIAARDVGGVLKGETATGSAIVRASVRLSLDRSWNPHAKVDISYDWSDPPGIDFLGQRIRFVSRADRELAGVIAGLERDLQKEVARTRIRPIVADAWKQGFTVIELNREKPPAWMRITPGGIGLTGFRVDGRRVKLTIAAQAVTETFVGDRPEAPQPVPLPPQIGPVADKGLRFFIPVVADYAQLEPVVLRALRKLAARGIRLEGVGHVNADFQKVTVYATEGGRLAVGIDAKVEPVGERFGTSLGKAQGRVWLTGLPYNDANSQVIQVRDLDIYGGADGMAADLLIQLMASEAVRGEIASGLTQDFGRDYDKVLAAAKKAIGGRQEGDFHLSATVDEVHHERVQVTGAGLFMPVTVKGTGQIRFTPRRAAR